MDLADCGSACFYDFAACGSIADVLLFVGGAEIRGKGEPDDGAEQGVFGGSFQEVCGVGFAWEFVV